MPDTTAKDLAQAHWSYIEALLRTHGEDEGVITKIGFHYRTAFEHGYKHAKEEAEISPDELGIILGEMVGNFSTNKERK